MTCAVYSIMCVADEGRRYIGGTTNIRRRWKEHRSGLRGGSHSNRRLQNAWDTYGEDAFRFCILQECTIADLRSVEDQMIKKHNSHENGYNLSHLGAGLTTEDRKKLSDRMKTTGHLQTQGILADARSEEGRRRRSETMKRLNATGQMRFKRRNK